MKLLPVGITEFEDLRQARQGHPGYVKVDR